MLHNQWLPHKKRASNPRFVTTKRWTEFESRSTAYAAGVNINHILEKRNAYDEDKIRKDFYADAMSQLLTGLIYLPLIWGISVEPNLDILNPKDKSFAPDLPSSLADFNCKSCPMWSAKYPASWTLQYKNNDGIYGTDRLFTKATPKDRIIGVILDKHEAVIAIDLPWDGVEPLLRDPLKQDLIGIKKCLYLMDVKDFAPLEILAQ